MPTHAPTEAERAIMRDVNRRMPKHGVADEDPEDPSQTLDDVGQIDVEPLDVDALPAAEGEADLARAMAESKEGDLEAVDDEDDGGDPRAVDTKETGKLYGVRTPHAADADLADGPDRGSFDGADDGENWLESLSRHAAEGGAAPAEEVAVLDETDDHGVTQPSEAADRPVADKGSGGPGGL
jgi:hypothetical protein